MFKLYPINMLTNKKRTIKVGITIVQAVQKVIIKTTIKSNIRNIVRVLGKVVRKEVSIKYVVGIGVRRLVNTCRNKIINKSSTTIFISENII